MERALEQGWVQAPQPVVRSPRVRRRQERRAISPASESLRENFTSVPVTPEVFAKNRLVAAIKKDPYREAYGALQATVAAKMEEQKWISLGVTGPTTGTGKSLTAANLSIALASQATRRVLLLDLNLRYPNIHTYFEHEPELGLEDCLYEGATLSEAAFEPSIDGLAVLAVRRPTFSATQILRSEGLRELLDTIKRDDPDRMIIVDLPSITSSEDARTFNSLVDSILFVVEESATREAHFRKALAMIGKAQLLGTVLNKVGGEL